MGETSSLNSEHHEHQPEQQRPRIYVASLADYVGGTLHGRWIRADQDLEAIREEIGEMLDESEIDDAEEYAIHDYEGFAPLYLHEYDSIETVARIARGIVEHGEAFAHWVNYCGTPTDHDQLALFDDVYLGCWPTVRAYAEELIDGSEVEETLDQARLPFRNYIRIDTELLARDLQIEMYISEGTNGVHIFAT